MLDQAREAVEGYFNSDGRSGRHILLGLVVTAGAAVAASALAARAAPPVAAEDDEREGAYIERARGAISIILPALASAATISALRVWNAPQSAARSTALRLWLGAQAVNALWLGVRPRRMAGQMLALADEDEAVWAARHQVRDHQPDHRHAVHRDKGLGYPVAGVDEALPAPGHRHHDVEGPSGRHVYPACRAPAFAARSAAAVADCRMAWCW